MFGIGFPEMILILALALIVVGPDKLPDLARSVAKTIMDLKKTAEGLKDNLNIEDNPLSEIKPQLEDAAKNFKDSVLDAETHTWNDDSLPPSSSLDPLEESLKVPPQTDQPEEKPPQENQAAIDDNTLQDPTTEDLTDLTPKTNNNS